MKHSVKTALCYVFAVAFANVDDAVNTRWEPGNNARIFAIRLLTSFLFKYENPSSHTNMTP